MAQAKTMMVEEMRQAVRLDLAYMVDLLADYDFVITEEEAFEAWLWNLYDGDDVIVWDSPFNFSDEVIVSAVKCFYEPIDNAELDGLVVSPIVDEWIDAETAAYVPKVNAKVEGFSYDAN
jgi:hypothetical protein